MPCLISSGYSVAMKRTLILEDSEVIMVVRKDVIEQIDEYRGELNRTEFVNLLIQNQLHEFHRQQDRVPAEEFLHLSRRIKDSLHTVLEILSGQSENKDNRLPAEALANLTP